MAIDRALRQDLRSLVGWAIVGVDGPTPHHVDQYLGLHLQREGDERAVVLGGNCQGWWLEADSLTNGD